MAPLFPGEANTDRPNILVRAFHARVEQTDVFTKQHLCQGTRYFVRVVGYQKRGLTHAHIVVAALGTPAFGSEVDRFISCHLPREESCLRTLVLIHMVHSCAHGCQPNDPQQVCIQGCPWPFADETVFDIRGYAHHRHVPCEGHCPNCVADRAAYEKHNVCLNRLIVECNPALLEF